MRIRTAVLTIVMSLLFATTLPAAQRGIKVTAKTSSGKAIPLYSSSYALVIGNGDYTNGWDPLPGAIRDVKDVSRALKENGFKVILKKNLTRNAFRQAFGRFFHKYGRNKTNRLLFYYAGHGYTQKMYTGEDQGYLVMVDAPAPEKDPVGFDIASIDMQVVVTQAKKVKARHVLFMFDSCFSGAILNLRERVVPEAISDSVGLPVRQFITAGRANEPVPDHSIFKQAFLDLLEGRDKEPIPDGYITGEELGLYLKNKVPEYNATQHPQYGKIKDIRLDKGDFVFALKMPTQPLPTTSPQSDATSDYDKLIQQRETAKREWIQWQIGMTEGFANADTYDGNQELTSKEKVEIWMNFLSSYSQNNPYSNKDEKMRENANERVEHWQSHELASFVQTPDDSGSSSKTRYQKQGSLYKRVDKDGKVLITSKKPVEEIMREQQDEVARDTNSGQQDEVVRDTNSGQQGGVVRDTRTGLEWKVGPDKEIDWHEARSWVQRIGGGWRMPTIDELKTIYKKASGRRNMMLSLKTTAWSVWSGDTDDSSDAWYFDFMYGRKYPCLRTHGSGNRAFAVRSQRKPQIQKVEVAIVPQNPSYSRLPGPSIRVIGRDRQYVAYSNGIVKDTITGLEWMVGPDKSMTWNESKAWVENLGIDVGWRMPTLDELAGLYKNGTGERNKRNITPLLKTNGWWVWSGEANGLSHAWLFDLDTGVRAWFIKDDTYLTRAFAVRSRGDG